jgi:hypothetical protein|tara:strand:+ start:3091 stop:3519 length:429 start_codon:yes stop_codon:yes gene_type:complete
MKSFRASCWQKKAIVAFMLLGLLLQVQTVFACQMMDHSGPIEHCCCDDMAANENIDEATDEQSKCCDISTELTVKADADEDEPVTISSNSSLDPPVATLVFLLVTLWPELAQSQSSPIIRDLNADPGHPGTQTYLSTLRLRI